MSFLAFIIGWAIGGWIWLFFTNEPKTTTEAIIVLLLGGPIMWITTLFILIKMLIFNKKEL